MLAGLAGHWPILRLHWFTHGFYSVHKRDRAIVIADLRMGQEPAYFFQFKVAEMGNPHAVPTGNERIRVERGAELLHWVWERIRNADVQLGIKGL